MTAILEVLYAEYKAQAIIYNDAGVKLNQLADIIKSYGGSVTYYREIKPELLTEILTDIKDSLYPRDATWAKKILFTLAKFKEPITSSQILDFITLNESKEVRLKVDLKGVVYSILSRMVKERRIEVNEEYSRNRYFLK